MQVCIQYDRYKTGNNVTDRIFFAKKVTEISLFCKQSD